MLRTVTPFPVLRLHSLGGSSGTPKPELVARWVPPTHRAFFIRPGRMKMPAYALRDETILGHVGSSAQIEPARDHRARFVDALARERRKNLHADRGVEPAQLPFHGRGRGARRAAPEL